jgi:hypothetical protein
MLLHRLIKARAGSKITVHASQFSSIQFSGHSRNRYRRRTYVLSTVLSKYTASSGSSVYCTAGQVTNWDFNGDISRPSLSDASKTSSKVPHGGIAAVESC